MVHCGLATMCNCHVAMVTASDSGIKELVYLNEETQMGTIACQLSDNYRILVFNLFGTCTFRDHPSLSYLRSPMSYPLPLCLPPTLPLHLILYPYALPQRGTTEGGLPSVSLSPSVVPLWGKA